MGKASREKKEKATEKKQATAKFSEQLDAFVDRLTALCKNQPTLIRARYFGRVLSAVSEATGIGLSPRVYTMEGAVKVRLEQIDLAQRGAMPEVPDGGD